MITEAGGLVGNFTGEADFLYQREVVAGNPKVYGQLVQHAGTVHARAIEDGRRRQCARLPSRDTPEAALASRPWRPAREAPAPPRRRCASRKADAAA